jgi:hypothetical protein
VKKFVDVSCPQCGHQIIDAFVTVPDYPDCPNCHVQTVRLYLPSSVPAVKGDDIPGGVWVKHGICNPDGSPKKYYSHSEIDRAAKEKGYVNRAERGVADKKDWDRLSSKSQVNTPPVPTSQRTPRTK